MGHLVACGFGDVLHRLSIVVELIRMDVICSAERVWHLLGSWRRQWWARGALALIYVQTYIHIYVHTSIHTNFTPLK